ncbi:hypothetical protein [Cloacibacillus evryensis]
MQLFTGSVDAHKCKSQDKEWWDLAWYLVGKYSDGYVIDDKTGKAETVGYPTEWLQQVGFGNNDAEPKK